MRRFVSPKTDIIISEFTYHMTMQFSLGKKKGKREGKKGKKSGIEMVNGHHLVFKTREFASTLTYI